MHVCQYCGTELTHLNGTDACPERETAIDLTGRIYSPPHEWIDIPMLGDLVDDSGSPLAPTQEELNAAFEKLIGPVSQPSHQVVDACGPLAPKPGLDEYGNRLPQDRDFRKELPVFDGCFDYFPDALAYVSMVSKEGADIHCGGVLGWDRTKSTDHLNCLGRHILDIRGRDPQSPKKLRHAGMAVWRLLAFLQLELEKAKMNGESWI